MSSYGLLVSSFLDVTQNGKKNDITTLGQSHLCHMELKSTTHKMEKIPWFVAYFN
jgi:hypothetical protein